MASVDERVPDPTAATLPAETDLGPPSLGTVADDVGDQDRPASALASHRYRLGPLIGRGGMGEVRAAHDIRIGREVAVKVMRRGASQADLRTRFLREARVQGRLEHPAIVPVHDMGVDAEGHPFFVMKRLTGLTLAEILSRRASDTSFRETWTRRALLDRLVGVCHAIEYAHQRGVVHRDVKPQNIMLGDLGEVYVLDWGIARIIGDEIERDGIADTPVPPGPIDPNGKTETGAMMGTPGYMAPEQLRGEPADQRSDVYALGCVLFELLTEQPALPRGQAALAATLSAQAHSPRERAAAADVPPELDTLCTCATEPDPARRLASAGALAAGIQRFLDGDRDLALRRQLANSHAAEAQQQLQNASDDDARAIAMREAGRALALDPTHQDAQLVVGRFLLEPPAKVPAAVGIAVQEHRDGTARLHSRTAALTYLGYLAFLPFLAFVHVVNVWPIIVILAIVLLNTTLLLAIARRPHAPQLWFDLVLYSHAVLLAACGTLTSTPLMLPAMAVTSLGAFIANPRVRSISAVVIVHVIAVFAPVLLELVGAIPPTFKLIGVTIEISTWSVELSAPLLLAVVMMASLSHLLATTAMVRQLRRAEESAQQAIHLHKWHLEQLLPARRVT